MEFLSVKLQTFKKNKKRRSLLFEKKKNIAMDQRLNKVAAQ